jgi:CTP synthase (UTP-ammonia lyase)
MGIGNVGRIDHHAFYTCCPQVSTKRKAKRTAFIHTTKLGLTIALSKMNNQGIATAFNTAVA